VQIWLLLAAIGTLKFGFGDLLGLLFGLFSKTMMANLGDVSISLYFVVSKLLILS